MKTMFGKYIVLFAALQVFLGCKNILEPPKPNVETGSFSLTINEANTGRTILPQTVQNNFAEYKLEFFATGEITNPLVSISRPYTSLSEPVLLNVGTWDLYVTAYLEDQEGELKPAVQGKLLGIGIGGGEVVNGSVTLEPIIDSGEGTFSWNIAYPANVTSAKITIHDLNEGREGYYTVWYFIGGDPLIDKEGSLPLDAGYYRVVFELINEQGRNAARREILHIYQNMESSFSYTFTDSNFLVEPLKAILSAWDEAASKWELGVSGITAAHFIVEGIYGVDDDNFDDIADWFDENMDSSAVDLSELKVLVDVALVGIAGNDDNFCNASQYIDRAAVETAIRSLVKNGTSVTIEWDQNDTVHIRLGGQHSVTITFSDAIPYVENDPLEGKLLILQAYGSSSSAAGVSHSFAELYNTTDAEINLTGIGLYYADGTDAGNGQTNTATKDGDWKRISLDGKTIPAKGSFLVLGPRQSQSARYQIPENSGDINDGNFTLSNRAFKVALLRSTADFNALNIQNPFDTDGEGTKAAGYIDMVGAANEYEGRDLILGFETLPARNSASEAVRRVSLTDTDVNRGPSSTFPAATGDFTSIRYAIGSGSISDELLEVRKPRNSSAGTWDPFAEPAEPPTPEPTDNTLLIFQVGAATDGNISHSFVELYNNGDEAVDLSGYSLQYAEGTRGTPSATEDGAWAKIDLSGTIPPRHSFLILGDEGIGQTSSTNPALALTAGSGDMNVSFVISNRSFKVALMSNNTLLTVQNPFDIGDGEKADGYIDMVGAMNTVGEDKINGYEFKPITDLNKQTGQRRTSLIDTDNNANDFARATFAGASSANFEKLKPKNLAHGEWDPFPEPPEVTDGSPKLMILQANIRGNDNGRPNSPTGGGFPRSLVELYNNTDTAIDLNNYSLHIGQLDNWIVRVPLTGKTIPAKSSFLIVSNATGDLAVNATPRASLPVADFEYDFIIGLTADGTGVGNNWKIALMMNLSQDAVLPANPFSDSSLAANYVDMLGVGGNTITGFEGSRASGSAPQGPRRTSLTDTDNNNADFAQADYRGRTGSNGVDNDQLYKYWPRNATSGAWNPITGLPKVDPEVIPVNP